MKTNRNQIQDRKLPNFGHIPFLFAIISCAAAVILHVAKIPEFEFLNCNEILLKKESFHNNKEILNNNRILIDNTILNNNWTKTIITIPVRSVKRHERTLIILKPDSIQRGLIGTIINRFEAKGFKLVGLKFVWPSKELVEEHYVDSVGRPHFPGLVKFISSGPVVPMVWEGLNAIKITRRMLGHSNPDESLPGTIRGDFSSDRERSIIHGSDTLDSAKREINLWFKESELISWTNSNSQWINA